MPNFFDSLTDFSEWFSKDVDVGGDRVKNNSQVRNYNRAVLAHISMQTVRGMVMSSDFFAWQRTQLRFRSFGQVSRLHQILKPFMLRRVKKDVEHELVPKIERVGRNQLI